MTNREKAIALIQNIPDDDLGFVVAYLQNLTEDLADDLFCENLYQDYMNSPDKDEFVSLEEVLRDLGGSNRV